METTGMKTCDGVAVKKTYDEVAVKKNKQNIIWLSIAFSFIYFGINTYKNFAVPLLGNLGAICLGTLYTVSALGNFIVPVILYLSGSVKGCLIVSCFVMVIYILQYAYLIPWFALVMCFVTGIFFSLSWSTESILLAQNSVDENISANSNMFYGIFMIGNVFGNTFGYVLLDLVGLDLSNRGNGWNGGISWLFIGLSVSTLIGSFLMFFVGKTLPTSPVKKVEVVATEPQVEKPAEAPKKKPWKMIGQKVIAVLRCLFQPRMLLLIMLFLNNGYAQLVVSSQITRQIADVKMVGLAMALFAVVEVITTAVSWKLADRAGNVVMLGIAVAAEILGAVSALYMNVHQGGWIFLPTAFFAVMDTIYQTECVSLVGKYFRSELEEASATYRFIQGLGSSLSSFVTPLFVTGNASASTQTQLTWEMGVAVLLAIISYLLVCLFVKIYGKKRSN